MKKIQIKKNKLILPQKPTVTIKDGILLPLEGGGYALADIKKGHKIYDLPDNPNIGDVYIRYEVDNKK